MIKTISKKKKCKKATWLSEKALQIAGKRRDAKGKGEKERYIHLNEEFQRIARSPILYSHTFALVILFGRVDMKHREGIRKKWWNSKEVGRPEIFKHQVLVGGWGIKVNLFAKDGERIQVKSDSASEKKKWKPTWKPTLVMHFLSARDSRRQITHFLTWPVCLLDAPGCTEYYFTAEETEVQKGCCIWVWS